jgi:hypothetical protein
MSNAIDDISEKLSRFYDLDTAASLVRAIIDSLNIKYPELDIAYLEQAIQDEEKRRSQSKAENEKIRKAMEPVSDYFERLITAAISEMIDRHGRFEIPGDCHDDEHGDQGKYEDVEDSGFFTMKVQNKYELSCLESWKDEMSNEGQFAVKPIGKLGTILNSHGLVIDRVEVEFNGAPGEESIVINDEAEIRDCMGEVSITWNENIKSENVIAAADEILKNPNRNLLIHDLKYSD